MKIEKKKLISFMKKIAMKDEQMIDQCLLEFKDDGLHTIATSPAKITRTSGHLFSSIFEQYDMIGNIGLNDIPKFIQILKRFGKFLTLSLEGNLLIIKETNKKVEIPLIDEEYFDEKEDPELEFIDRIHTNAGVLNEVFKDVMMNTDATITIETEPGKAILSNTGKYKFQTIVEDSTLKGGAKSTFGSPAISALEELDGDVVVNVGVDYPLQVIEKTIDSSIMVIVAPRIEPGD